MGEHNSSNVEEESRIGFNGDNSPAKRAKVCADGQMLRTCRTHFNKYPTGGIITEKTLMDYLIDIPFWRAHDLSCCSEIGYPIHA